MYHTTGTTIPLYYTCLILLEMGHVRTQWKACTKVGPGALNGHMFKRNLRILI